METLIKDIRYGIRSFLKRPGFLFIAISTLALGIGATTALFTVVNSVLLRPLQFPEPERVVIFEEENRPLGIVKGPQSVPDIDDWQKQSQSFEQFAAYYSHSLLLKLADETDVLRAARVTPEFFPIFHTNPIQGRLFQADDFQSSEPAVISYALWQRKFGGRTDVVNST